MSCHKTLFSHPWENGNLVQAFLTAGASMGIWWHLRGFRKTWITRYLFLMNMHVHLLPMSDGDTCIVVVNQTTNVLEEITVGKPTRNLSCLMPLHFSALEYCKPPWLSESYFLAEVNDIICYKGEVWYKSQTIFLVTSIYFHDGGAQLATWASSEIIKKKKKS